MTRQTTPLPGEEAWIPSPVDGDLLWPRRAIFGGEAAWTPYRGARRACDLCVEVLYDHRSEPYPRQPASPAPATLKRKGPNGESFLCSRHGQDYRERDNRIQPEPHREGPFQVNATPCSFPLQTRHPTR